MTGIILLFRDDAKDSEKFVLPNITNIKVGVESSPDTLYVGGSGGLTRTGLYDAARNTFLDYEFNTVSPEDFFIGNKFAAVIDMRGVNDKNVVLAGRKILSTQEGILLVIEKEATTKDLTCNVFVASHGIIDIVGNQYSDVTY